MWKTLNDLGLSRRASDPPIPFDANTLNSHFVTTVNSQTFTAQPSVSISPDDQFFFNHVEASDVVETIKSGKSNANGPDRIPLRYLKDCLPVILIHLMHIFDFSLQSGVFPSSWKRAIVRPLPKTKRATALSDFRPISILCAASKILESLAAKQISSFIAKRGILDSCQSGFRKGYSTHTALVKMVDDFKVAIDKERITLLVAIDFSKAFDVMCIDVLIHKLRLIGFSDSACRWIRSFLFGRSQSTSLPDGTTSEPLGRNSGVPQGSVLGPLLFSLFINDLPSAIRFCKHHLYADDFVIYYSGTFKDIHNIIEKINVDLSNISRWAADNGLGINVNKTQAMWIGSRLYVKKIGALHLPPILLDSKPIDVSDCVKVLGVTLDSTLSWRNQCSATARKSFAALARLRKLHGFLPSSTRLMLIKTLVFPYFDYCAGLFLGLTNDLNTKLTRCKNAAVRFVTGTKIWEHITADYVANHLLSVEARRDYLALCLLVSILKSGNPQYLACYFRFKDRGGLGSKRLSSLDIIIPRFDTEYLRSSFHIGVAYLWNSLPHDLRRDYRLPSFKRRLYEFLFNRNR